MDESLIVSVIRRYFPEWEPPRDTGRDWIPCLCAFHGESNKSASVSFKHNAYRCHGCAIRGDAVSIIRMQEEVTYSEAKRLAETISPGSHNPIPRKSDRKPSRRIPSWSETGPDIGPSRDRQVPARIRSRRTPWS